MFNISNECASDGVIVYIYILDTDLWWQRSKLEWMHKWVNGMQTKMVEEQCRSSKTINFNDKNVVKLHRCFDGSHKKSRNTIDALFFHTSSVLS